MLTVFRYTTINLVGPSGLEPPTSRLSVVRSNQLSYGPSSLQTFRSRNHVVFFIKVSGGDKRDRTVDPLLAKQVLSQLSYTPKMRTMLKVPKFCPPFPSPSETGGGIEPKARI